MTHSLPSPMTLILYLLYPTYYYSLATVCSHFVLSTTHSLLYVPTFYCLPLNLYRLCSTIYCLSPTLSPMSHSLRPFTARWKKSHSHTENKSHRQYSYEARGHLASPGFTQTCLQPWKQHLVSAGQSWSHVQSSHTYCWQSVCICLAGHRPVRTPNDNERKK